MVHVAGHRMTVGPGRSTSLASWRWIHARGTDAFGGPAFPALRRVPEPAGERRSQISFTKIILSSPGA
jgi:hypothetical protein